MRDRKAFDCEYTNTSHSLNTSCFDCATDTATRVGSYPLRALRPLMMRITTHLFRSGAPLTPPHLFIRRAAWLHTHVLLLSPPYTNKPPSLFVITLIVSYMRKNSAALCASRPREGAASSWGDPWLRPCDPYLSREDQLTGKAGRAGAGGGGGGG